MKMLGELHSIIWKRSGRRKIWEYVFFSFLHKWMSKHLYTHSLNTNHEENKDRSRSCWCGWTNEASAYVLATPLSCHLLKHVHPGISPFLLYFIHLHPSIWIIPISTRAYVYFKTNKETSKSTYSSQPTSFNSSFQPISLLPWANFLKGSVSTVVNSSPPSVP